MSIDFDQHEELKALPENNRDYFEKLRVLYLDIAFSRISKTEWPATGEKPKKIHCFTIHPDRVEPVGEGEGVLESFWYTFSKSRKAVHKYEAAVGKPELVKEAIGNFQYPHSIISNGKGKIQFHFHGTYAQYYIKPTGGDFAPFGKHPILEVGTILQSQQLAFVFEHKDDPEQIYVLVGEWENKALLAEPNMLPHHISNFILDNARSYSAIKKCLKCKGYFNTGVSCQCEYTVNKSP